MIVLAFVTLGARVATVGNPVVISALLYGCPALMLYIAWVLFSASRRPGKEPDYLGQVTPKYFERDGLCLAPVFETADGPAFLCVYFQNRYAGHASARFAMLPPLRSFGFGRHKLPRVSVDFEVPGGAFGVLRLKYAVPAKYQGRRIAFEVGADVTYPARRGELLRYRGGRNLPPTRHLDNGTQLLTALLLGWIGIFLALSSSSRGRAKLVLPTGVDETGPDVVNATREILAVPDLPTGGFPVLKAAA